MASTSESGHANNVANLDDLNSFVAGYGAAYNPPKVSIKLPALQALATSAKTALNTYNLALPAYKNAVDAKEAAFKVLSPLVRRINNFVKASDTTDIVDGSVNSLVKKIIGERVNSKKTEEEKQALVAAGKEVKEISTSQMGYDNRIDNFDKLVKMLTTIPQYIPNEADLKVTALTALLTDLKAKNAAVVAAYTTLSNARISRNDILYKDLTGVYDIAADVKLYVKSLFGATSPQYKQLSALKFTKQR